MHVYVHEFVYVYVQLCMVKHGLTSKGYMNNCCHLLTTT